MRNNKNLRNFYDLVNTMLVALSKKINTISQLLVLLIFITFIMVSGQLQQQQQNSQQPPAVQQSSTVVEKNFEQQQEEIVMAILVEAGQIECLYQPVINPKYNSFEIDYQVIEGGEITFSVKSPSGVIIVSDQRQMDGAHKINIDEAQNGRGDYALCFDNSFSYTGAKRVFFEIFLLDKDGNYLNDYDRKIQQDQGHGLLAEHLETFNIVTNKVKNNLNEVERMQSQFRAIEARDRSSIETAFERINFWSAIHLLSMLFAVGCQVYMVRSLFIEESRIGRFMRHGKLK